MRLLGFGVVLLAVASCSPPSGACGPGACDGCCDEQGHCRNDDDACGSGGTACSPCGAGYQCTPAGICMATATGGGGGDAQGGGDGQTGGGASSSGGGVSTNGGGTAGGGHNTGGGGGTQSTGGGGSDTCQVGDSCLLGSNIYGECCAANSCISISDDVNNCGGCGVHCAAGSSCTDGVCSSDCHVAGCPSGTSCVKTFDGTACYPNTCAASQLPCTTGNNDPGVCCGSTCKDFWWDNNNCGGCGNRCTGGTFCSYGFCEQNTQCSTGASGECEVADGGHGSCCGGTCAAIDYQNDRENCGGCGYHCPLGNTCSQGVCHGPDGGGVSDCSTDAGACGDGLACTAGAICKPTVCGATTVGEQCVGAAGYPMCCGTRCVDIERDHDNCDGCGKACAGNQFCDNGQCKASPTCNATNAGTDCPAADGGIATCCANGCVDVTIDSNNCGACGVQCPAGNVCSRGYCSLPDAGYRSCLGDPNACPTGTVCDGTRCLALQCPTNGTGETCGYGAGYGNNGYVVIAGKCCGGACTDLNQDPKSCGTCGTACTTGPGLCTPGAFFGAAQCLPVISTNCFNCGANSFCANGFCQPSSCQQGFSGGSCLANSGGVGTCCPFGFGSQCTDVANDVNNCGGCGISCGGGTCTNGVCSTTVAPCTKGHAGQFCNLDAGTQFACCPGGGCIDTSSDEKNCGRCGNVCTPGLSCLDSKCVALSCTASLQGYTCEDDAGTVGSCCGTSCVHRGVDPNNCGSCGHHCVGAETCVGGECGLPVCDPQDIGSACHMSAGTGLCCTAGCVDTDHDVNNCGGCNRHCPADAGCVNGNCQ